MMKAKREEELEKQLSTCKAALQRERQKNRDINQSRDKYNLKTGELNEEKGNALRALRQPRNHAILTYS
jgi:hypothetical protein